MAEDISDNEVRLALADIEQRRRQVIAEAGLPRWYWWGLAAGWIGLGIIGQLDHPWLTIAATVCFGAAHASIAGRILSGRHRSRQLSVRSDVVNPHIPALVIGFLLMMIGTTVLLAVLADSAGARYPSVIASVIVAVAVVVGGPWLLATAGPRLQRRHAA
jgi:hypothetical protein